MDITVNAVELKKALRFPKAASGKGSSIPTLQGLRLSAAEGNLTVEGTDTVLLAVAQVPAVVVEEGAVVINAASLEKLLKHKGDARIFTEDDKDDKVSIVNGVTAVLPILPVEDWPQWEHDFSSAPSFEVPLDRLAEILPAASADAGRPILTGIFFSDGDMAATDSYRLHVRRGVETPERPLLLPRDVLLQVLKSGHDARVFVLDENARTERSRLNLRVKVTAGPNTWYCWPLDGEFPNYKQLIPASWPNRLVVDRDELLEMVAKVRVLVSTQDAAPVRLALTKDSLRASVKNFETEVAGDMACDWNGEDMTLAFTAEYLTACAKACPENTLVIGVTDALKPAGFMEGRSDGTTAIRLLMPVRIP